MGCLARMAGVISLVAALLPPAFAANPLADQPGALFPAEIQAAREAMRAAAGREQLELIASGKRSGEHVLAGYAVFAGPPVTVSGRIKSRRRVICNFVRPAGRWQCPPPHEVMQVTANGVEHAFAYVAIEGSADKGEGVDIADYLYSACFAAQFKAAGGTKGAPPFNAYPINIIMKGPGAAITVRTGLEPEEDVYLLEKADAKAVGCGFKMKGVRMGRTGLTLPESYAKEIAEQAAKDAAAWRANELAVQKERERAMPRKAPDEGISVQEVLAMITFFAAMAFGVLALVVPRSLRSRGRWAAANAAGALAAACTLAAVFSAALVPATYNIRVDLLINGPLVLIAWINFAGLAISAAASKKQG